MNTKEYKRIITEKIEQTGESDRNFLRQILILLRMHMERTGRL